MAKTKVAAPKPPKVKVKAPAKTASGNTGKRTGGYTIQTGDNERKTVKYGGTTIRVAPNSSFNPKAGAIAKNAPKPTIKSKAAEIWDYIMGRGPTQTPSGVNGVRG